MSKRKPTEEEQIATLWHELSGYPLWDKGRKALENYILLLSFADVEEAVIVAAERDDSRINCFRYCCGILRNKLAEKLDPEFSQHER